MSTHGRQLVGHSTKKPSDRGSEKGDSGMARSAKQKKRKRDATKRPPPKPPKMRCLLCGRKPMVGGAYILNAARAAYLQVSFGTAFEYRLCSRHAKLIGVPSQTAEIEAIIERQFLQERAEAN